MRHKPRWIAAVPVTMLAVATTGAMADPPAASRPVSPPPLVGFALHDSRIAESVALLEQGHPDDAVSRLAAAVRKAEHGPHSVLNELRLGLGMVLLRAGNAKAAITHLLPLTQIKPPSHLSRRAHVLHALAVQHRPRGSATASLATRDEWRTALLHAHDDIVAAAREDHRKITDAIAARRWPDVPHLLDDAAEQIERSAVIELDDLRLRQADLHEEHAHLLAAHVRDINVAIAQSIHQAGDLAGQMSEKYDRNSKRRGYLPADVVTRYNATLDDAATASVIGERCVTAYGTVVANSNGRIKRDTSVKMSKTRLPAKRSIFGR